MLGPQEEPVLPAEADDPAGRLWIDLLNPSEEDRRRAAETCGLRLPTREDLSEIESSSRHFQENDAVYLSAALVKVGDGEPRLTPVGFILSRRHLITVRFEALKAFDTAAKRMREHQPASPLDAFTVLIEEVIDRKADVLEEVGAELERLSQAVFHRTVPKRRTRAGDEMREVLVKVGQAGDQLSKMRSSLLTTGRILAYVFDEQAGRSDDDLRRRLASARDDVGSLTSYSETLQGKVAFLLDAVLGFINIDQNDVIKVLTVVSVVGVPPTFVASMYGMNFKNMPELNWHLGYPYALALIFLSAVLPLAWFKTRGWF